MCKFELGQHVSVKQNLAFSLVKSAAAWSPSTALSTNVNTDGGEWDNWHPEGVITPLTVLQSFISLITHGRRRRC